MGRPGTAANERVGNYTLSSRLGEGTFGTVYKASHAHVPGERVAVKVRAGGRTGGWAGANVTAREGRTDPHEPTRGARRSAQHYMSACARCRCSRSDV